MTKLTPILLGLTFVIAVVALWLVLMLFITKPWDGAITEAELSEILRAEQETSSEEKEADRVAKCESVIKLALLDESPLAPAVASQLLAIVLENNCLLD